MVYSVDTLRDKLNKAMRFCDISMLNWLILESFHDTNILESLNYYCPKVSSDEYDAQTKIYWFMNGLKDFPKCMNEKCNNTFEHRNVIDWKTGYRKYCCRKCINDSPERKMHYIETCRSKYGVDNASQAQVVKDKKKQQAIERYGVDNVAKAPEVQAKIQQTNLERYGTKIYMNSDEAIKQRRQKYLKKYGVDWPQKSREFMRNMQKRYTYNNMNFDSKPELAYYIWLKDHNVDFTYQPDVSFTYEYDGSQHSYEPDFIVENQLIEIKGDHFFKDDGTMQNPFDHSQDALYECKHQCMLKNNVKIIRSNDYVKYLEYIEQTYGKDYLGSFKNKL